MNQRTMLISANLRQVDNNFNLAVEGNVLYDAFLLQLAEQFCTLSDVIQEIFAKDKQYSALC